MTRKSVLLAAAGLALSAGAAAAQDHPHDHDHQHHHPAPAESPADPHAGHDMVPAADPHAAHAAEGHAGHAMPATGLLGAYPMSRDASGTSWQPDASTHGGLHAARGDWTLMGHALFNLVWDRQDGPRGGEKTFVSGMVMGAARRDLANGDVVNLRAMLSPEPPMGEDGYPVLLAAGETADGVTPLVDRQHPHDLFMELSASYTRRLGERDSVFLYAGLPGEPAFGPPAFMHRLTGADSPEPPITHHWLDSTHIVFGVVTAGWVHDDFKLEASSFRGREPDQDRWDIEAPDLDSWAVRAAWNPTPEWSLQASWADVTAPEQLAPGADETKWSASAIHTRRLGDAGWWSTTAAWGRRIDEHDVAKDAWLLETALRPNRGDWTLFGRAERIETDELLPPAGGGHHGEIFTVGKVSAGAIRDWRLTPDVTFGLGALYAWNFVPGALEAAYGDDRDGTMVFARLRIG